ncbi:hypothetical protein GA0115239_11015 [Streptomyces sp. BpilaLS-43]|nr:hypothetical protein GA0115239_11015 [Streptomyces sp. BpilaLS-43]
MPPAALVCCTQSRWAWVTLLPSEAYTPVMSVRAPRVIFVSVTPSPVLTPLLSAAAPSFDAAFPLHPATARARAARAAP